MTKKKQPNSDEDFKSILAAFDTLFGNIEKESGSNKTIQRLQKSMQNAPNMVQCTYSHQHADYRLQAKPIADYLQELNQLEWDFEIPREIITTLLAMPKKKLSDDLENLIINDLAEYYQQVADGEEPDPHSRFIVALLILQKIRSKKSLDIALELLRQDLGFMDTFFADSSDDIFPAFVYYTGKEQLPKLLQFMQEPGLIPFGKGQVAMAVANIAVTTPSRRLEVISWFCQVLNFLYDHRQDERFFDNMLIDSISFSLINIQGTEALPLLEKIYAAVEILPFMAPDIEEIRDEIGTGAPLTGIDEEDDIYDTLEMLEDYYYNDIVDWDEEEDEETWEEAEEVEIEKRNTPAKCYTLIIKLKDVSPEIWRRVQVPSNLTLPDLHIIIQVAMGWENDHLHQFIKGKTYYLPPSEIAESNWISTVNQIDYTNVAIGEVLTRKGSKIEYEYDFGDSWMHEIKLEEHRPYRKDEKQHDISLLDGANACPPEDCGGCYGYSDLQEAMLHPRSKAYKEYIEWLGERFDPKAFDSKKTEKQLRSLKF